MSVGVEEATTLDELAGSLNLAGRPGDARGGVCPRCGGRSFWVTLRGFTCGSEDVDGCGWRGSLEDLEAWVEAGHQEAVVVRLADVKPEKVLWLWGGRIPLGRLTIFDGDPGVGKSSVTLDIAARVTRGDRMPDGSPGLPGPRGVVLLGCEDGLADTVRPRLDAAGADVHRVVALQAVRDEEGRPRLPTVADVGAIATAARVVDAAILIVDPLSAFLGRGIDAHRDTDVRQALASLAELAERTGLAVLAIRHLSKSGGANPLYRGGGSIAIIAAARSGLLLARDPDDDSRRVLATTKCNLAPEQPSLALRLDSSSDALRVEWLGESERSAGDLLTSDSEDRSARDEAAELLRAELRDGPKAVPVLRSAARSAGISWRTMERAKATLKVVSVKLGFDAGGWVWKLPTEDRHAGWRTSQDEGVAVLDITQRLSQENGVAHAEDRQTKSLADFGPKPGDSMPDHAHDVDELFDQGADE